MKATQQHFRAVLLMLCKVVLTFEKEDEVLKCDHSNESYLQYFPVVVPFVMLKQRGSTTFECIFLWLSVLHRYFRDRTFELLWVKGFIDKRNNLSNRRY